jgi:CubicO group peptidase (beta-lactamase class C family)
MLERSRRLEAFAKWRVDWEPGSRFQYHLTAAAWVIAELVERRAGVPFAEYLRTEIVEPLGLGLMLPVPADRFDEVLAVPVATDRTSDDQAVDPWGPWYLNSPEVLAGGEPSHSIAGTAADMAMLFQAFFHTDLWPDGIVREATRTYHSEAAWGERLYGGSDETTNMALFCVVKGELGNSFTPRTGSARTFGNGGAPFQLAFMDPEAGTSFAFLTNGYPLAGYDYTRFGDNLRINIANLGNDLVGRP